MNDRLRDWAPELVVGVVVTFFGALEVWSRSWEYDRAGYVPVVLAFAVASALSRKAPLAALVLVWVTCGLQLAAGVSVLTVQFAVAVVAFGCARWGRPVTVVLSGLSIPAAAGIGYVLVSRASQGAFRDIAVFRELMDSAY